MEKLHPIEQADLKERVIRLEEKFYAGSTGVGFGVERTK